MNQRGEYGERSVVSGGHQRGCYGGVAMGKVFFSRSDFEQGIKQLDTDFSTLINEAISIMGGDPKVLTRSFMQKAFGEPKLWAEVQKTTSTIEKSKFHPYYKQVLMPLYNEWNEFLGKPVGVTEAITEALFSGPFGSIGPSALADKLKRWQARLNAARADMNTELKRLGKEPLRSPGSVALPETWYEKGTEGVEKVASGIGDIGSVLKWAVIGVVAVGGVVAVSSLVSRVKRDDGGPGYIERFRERRAARRATPKVIEAKSMPLALPAATPA